MTLSLEMQLQMIQDAGTELVEAEATSVFLRDSKTDELCFFAAIGEAADGETGEVLWGIPGPLNGSIARGWSGRANPLW